MDIAALKRFYEQAHSRKDIAGHLNKIYLYASSVKTIAELGTGSGAATSALALGRPEFLLTVDIEPHANAQTVVQGISAAGQHIEFRRQSSLEITLPEVELLMIDTWHTHDQLKEELELHHTKARKFILFHDMGSFGFKGEDGGEGMIPALGAFLRNHPEWIIHEHNVKCNGLTVIRRIAE